jgi:hypothetical protein
MAHSEYAYATEQGDVGYKVLIASYIAGTVFAVLWLLEMILKIGAFGFKGYLVGVDNKDENMFSMNIIEFILATSGYTQQQHVL